MKHAAIPFYAIVLMSLSSCSSRDEENASRQNVFVETGGHEVVPEESAAQPGNNATMPTNPSSPAANRNEIPLAIQGRWGMVKADCTSTHGDAKGLLEISKDTLTFYESRGKISAASEWEPTRIRASFAFEGEGMTWKQDMVLDVQDGGQTLIRRDIGKDAPPGPYRYSRCA